MRVGFFFCVPDTGTIMTALSQEKKEALSTKQLSTIHYIQFSLISMPHNGIEDGFLHTTKDRIVVNQRTFNCGDEKCIAHTHT
jgi:hypothetical protein